MGNVKKVIQTIRDEKENITEEEVNNLLTSFYITNGAFQYQEKKYNNAYKSFKIAQERINSLKY